MKKLSKDKVNYRKHERKMFARQDRRSSKTILKQVEHKVNIHVNAL